MSQSRPKCHDSLCSSSIDILIIEAAFLAFAVDDNEQIVFVESSNAIENRHTSVTREIKALTWQALLDDYVLGASKIAQLIIYW